MRSYALLALVLALTFAVACTRRMPPVATAADAERSQVPLGELEQGRTLVIRKCGRCHDTPLPSDQPAAEWPQIVGDMAERSKLEGTERTAIERYLVALTSR